MQPVPISVLATATSRIRPRTALVASADRSFRQRLTEILTGLRWQVREAEGGAQAWAEAEAAPPEAIIVDSWLPDLDLAEFLKDFRGSFPASGSGDHRRRIRRGEPARTLSPGTALCLAPHSGHRYSGVEYGARARSAQSDLQSARMRLPGRSPRLYRRWILLHSPSTQIQPDSSLLEPVRIESPAPGIEPGSNSRLPELIGDAPCMLEISRRVRLVAPRMTPVLIEGPTGSGKEMVAEALHRLSPRSRKPFVAINCAAIPEELLEAELFGHTRGAFTGAVKGRVGRIESADGGTLFLDEIGEMPLALQSKLLRFVESGELQRVGDNETVKVDVRIIAATHRPLAEHTKSGEFRADLYYRLAVFLIRTPSLAEHAQDLPLLVEHFMQRLGREEPVKRVDKKALARLAAARLAGQRPRAGAHFGTGSDSCRRGAGADRTGDRLRLLA